MNTEIIATKFEAVKHMVNLEVKYTTFGLNANPPDYDNCQTPQ